MKLRRWITFILMVVLIIPVGQAFAANATKSVKVSFAPIHYIVDGVDYAPPGGLLGFINNDNNSTYVPLRFVGTILGKSVKWDATASKVMLGIPLASETKEINAYLSDNKVEIPIEVVDKSKIKSTSIEVSMRELHYEFDGQEVKPDAKTPGFIYNDSIYVPLRFVYESNGFAIKWDQSTYSITTATPAYITTQIAVTQKIASCKSTGITKGLGVISNINKLTPEEVQASIADMDAMIADCRDELNIKLDELMQQLTDAGKSVEMVDKFRAEMDDLEASANEYIDKYR